MADNDNGEVLLYYKYINIDDPDGISEWQRSLCTEHGIRGRIRIAAEGINGTVGGSHEAIAAYERAMKQHQLFNDIQFKRSPGSADDFDDLMIRTCKEIVSLGIDPKRLTVTEGGKHLSPQEFHKEILQAQRKNKNKLSETVDSPHTNPDEEQIENGAEETNSDAKETLLLDCRNYYEARIGHFEGAVKPVIRKFDAFVDYVDENLDNLREKKVLMYCTGGDTLRAGFGIHCYLEEFPEGGFFKGKNLVFDKRVALGSQNPTKVGHCFICTEPFDDYKNEFRCPVCRQLIILCNLCEGPVEKVSHYLQSIIQHSEIQAEPTLTLSEEKLKETVPDIDSLSHSLQEVLKTSETWVDDFRGKKVPVCFRCEECTQMDRTPGVVVRRPRSQSRNNLFPIVGSQRRRRKRKKSKQKKKKDKQSDSEIQEKCCSKEGAQNVRMLEHEDYVGDSFMFQNIDFEDF
eukprot:CAMPEP_0117755616 /NCGR_PEP_ID=MMETSP0947-20121206/13557_1 /TAXON_ID=44440 /ORGANISM="Chattonella subsalsa, Strain CCMP2191" /LENGTH=458 /DNA_ID=CAMNT_0005574983 /DNA_START=64 /DNA_END=1439 /DNA_ORIENTATION=+